MEKFNHRFKIKKGLSKIRFEDLGIEQIQQQKEDEQNIEEEKELKSIKKKYTDYVNLITLKKELQILSQKLVLNNEQQNYLFENQSTFSDIECQLTSKSTQNCLQLHKNERLLKMIELKKCHLQLNNLNKQLKKNSDDDEESENQDANQDLIQQKKSIMLKIHLLTSNGHSKYLSIPLSNLHLCV